MATITFDTKCGNSPRQELIRNFNQAFADGDVEKILSFMDDDVEWHFLGLTKLKGKKGVEEIISEPGYFNTENIHLEAIITHGDMATAHGEYTDNTNETFYYCDIYEFAGFKKESLIKQITTFIIKKS